MFTLASITLCVVIGSLIGLVFFLIFGHGWFRLGIYWLVALAGFFVGQIVTTLLSFSLFPIGSVNLVEAAATSLLALFLTRAVWK